MIIFTTIKVTLFILMMKIHFGVCNFCLSCLTLFYYVLIPLRPKSATGWQEINTFIEAGNTGRDKLLCGYCHIYCVTDNPKDKTCLNKVQ